MQRQLRPDIQVLRGFAVSIVVLFHTRLGFVEGGFLGVDIFFVISGFLITGLLARQIGEEEFSFTNFYFRRAKRLLPAAYTTFCITTLVGAFTLTATEFRAFANQLLGAVTFLANFVLLRQGSYFGGDADFKPLLHTWSLSIEEQYYLIIPALLFFLPRRWWLRFAVFVALASFAACIVVGMRQPDWAFYLFPTRAWEMALGSIGAFVSGTPHAKKIARILFWPSLAVMAILPFAPFSGQHPGIDALLSCLATLFIILRVHGMFGHRAFRPIVWVGDISYSLYLVHWPLFSLANNMWIGEKPLWVTMALVVASVLLAWAQYRLVEKPVHYAPFGFTWRRAGLAFAVSLSVIAVPRAAMLLGSAPPEMIAARQGNTGLGPVCVSDSSFTPNRACETAERPTMLVWGDSYAMHLVPGIVQERGDERVAQATKYICGPLLDVSPISHQQGASQTKYWAEGCINYNREVLDFIKHTPSIRTIVLASVFDAYMTKNIGLYSPAGETPGGVEPALRAIERTVRILHSLGKRVIIVGPPPALSWDAGQCTERRIRGLPTFGRFADCDIPDADYRVFRANVLRFIAEARTRLDVDVVTFDDYLRRGDHYVTWPTGRIWFITNGHLSYQGSKDIVKGMGLVPTILARAR